VCALKEGAEIVIATPGRLMELIRSNATNLQRCSFVVLDEADRMFEMGFEYQVRSIVEQVRPDRQTLLFSATFKSRLESLASSALKDPIRIQIGETGSANADVAQQFLILPDDGAKFGWLMGNLRRLIAGGKVLVFVSRKIDAEELSSKLARSLPDIGQISCIHGDLDQTLRSEAIRRLKSGISHVLVGTDVAARGLDIKGINSVVNYNVAKTVDQHVHRIGRTGRMGIDGVTPGIAYTFLTQRDNEFASDLIRNLRMSSQVIPQELEEVARAPTKGNGNRFAAPGHGWQQQFTSQQYTTQQSSVPSRSPLPFVPAQTTAISGSSSHQKKKSRWGP